MSRCFPYPPPGHLRNGAGARGESVSESIKLKRDLNGTQKLERDLKNAITRHDKKKSKEKSRKEKKEACSVATCSQPENSLLKGKEEEGERSSLTEEHGQPVCSQYHCYSSDSTRSSKKRKVDDLVEREVDDSVVNATKNQGNIIRIRLPLQRHREPNASSNMEQLCSTSGRAGSLPELKQVIAISRPKQCSTRDSKSVVEPASEPIEPTSGADLERKEKSSRHSSKIEKKEKKYKSLFEYWAVPSLEYEENSFDDQEWLCAPKRQEERHEDKRLKISHCDEPCHEGPALWPCARYLHQADIYALPYTIPF